MKYLTVFNVKNVEEIVSTNRSWHWNASLPSSKFYIWLFRFRAGCWSILISLLSTTLLQLRHQECRSYQTHSLLLVQWIWALPGAWTVTPQPMESLHVHAGDVCTCACNCFSSRFHGQRKVHRQFPLFIWFEVDFAWPTSNLGKLPSAKCRLRVTKTSAMGYLILGLSRPQLQAGR